MTRAAEYMFSSQSHTLSSPVTPHTDLMIRRRLIVCCDGTQNDGINTLKPLTNVARIARCIHDEDERVTADRNDAKIPIQQITYYKAGVGTGTSKTRNLFDAVNGTGMSATNPMPQRDIDSDKNRH
jgi:uncharacterized protein (DUF2235 family)